MFAALNASGNSNISYNIGIGFPLNILTIHSERAAILNFSGNITFDVKSFNVIAYKCLKTRVVDPGGVVDHDPNLYQPQIKNVFGPTLEKQ